MAVLSMQLIRLFSMSRAKANMPASSTFFVRSREDEFPFENVDERVSDERKMLLSTLPIHKFSEFFSSNQHEARKYNENCE